MLLLLTIVLAIMEFGFMFFNYMGLSEVGQAGCRSASLGSKTSVVLNRISQTATGVGLNNSRLTTIVLEYRTYTKATGVWSGWTTLGDATNYNDAPANDTYDSQVRVRLKYDYALVTGSFLAPIVGQGGIVSLAGTAVMRREETP